MTTKRRKAQTKGQTQAERSELREWIDQQYAEDPGLKTRVDELLAEMTLEQDLVKLREARGLSQSTVAKLLGVTQPAVAKLETDKIKNAKLSTLVRYAAALGGRVKVEIVPTRRRLVGLRRVARAS
jgi:predicted XRE-type DNA-binding protein